MTYAFTYGKFSSSPSVHPSVLPFKFQASEFGLGAPEFGPGAHLGASALGWGGARTDGEGENFPYVNA